VGYLGEGFVEIYCWWGLDSLNRVLGGLGLYTHAIHSPCIF
jgi:hypothetical protein